MQMGKGSELVDASSRMDTVEAVSHWLRSKIAVRSGRAPEEIRDDDLFSAVGIDSMRAVAIMAELSEVTGTRLSPALMWSHPSIAALAARVVAGESEAPAELPDTFRSAPRTHEPIAITGMSCRLPGADGLEEFWQLLRSGTDAVSEVPAERWDAAAYLDTNPAAAGKMVTSQAGFLRGPVDTFDPLFFGISPREAQEMDPQQRLFLEVAWEALEDAGLSDGRLSGTATGVFAGAIWHDYADLGAADPAGASLHSATGRALNMVANRLSYVLGLAGPSIVLDSACSSSLLAVHLACQSIWAGESETAVAGGVNLLLSPETMVSLSKFGGLSPDGRCKAFDARGDGFGRGEGAAAIVLKPLSKALADGDDIWCTIRGTATNNDGLSNGLTAPNPLAQEAVLRTACRQAGVSPAEVQYVETHGTGTALGDPVEATALGAVYGRGRGEDAALRIGSVKSNIGHLEAAAGIAGVVKTALALRHRVIPPSIHFETPNPHIPFEELGLRVAAAEEPWPASGQGPARAGVSAFGWGGTNVHVVLEAVTAPAPLTLAEVPGTGTSGRPQVAFVCSPYGQQWIGMARTMLRTEPVFRSVLEECDRELARYTGWSLLEELYTDEPAAPADPARSGDVGVVQPLLFAIQVGIAAWLEAAGVRPDAVVGHSLGEVAAAVIAGILDLPDAVRLIHHYSDQQRRVAGSGSGMAVVELSAADLQRRIDDRDGGGDISVATQNGPRATGLAGSRAALEALVAELKAEGVLCSMIRVDLPAHSAGIDPITADLEAAIGTLTPRPGRIPMISSVTGEPLDWREADASYFVRNLRRPVLLAPAVAHLLAHGTGVLVEISANPVLAPALRQSAEEHGGGAAVLTTMSREGDDDRAGLVDTLGALAGLGLDVRLPGEAPVRAELFTLSARTPQALRDLAVSVAAALSDGAPGADRLASLARAGLERAHHPYRLSLVAHDTAELAAALIAHADGERPPQLYEGAKPAETRPRTAFVFPGQGSQWLGMGRELLRTEPAFAASIRTTDAAARAWIDWSVEAELCADEEDSQLTRIDVVQPVLFAVEVALAALWRSWGIEPDAVVGHSMGEVAAAHVSGALSVEDATRIICRRSLLLRRAAGQGAMLACELTMAQARELLVGQEHLVSVGVNNSPRSTVLSGDRDVLTAIAARLEADQVFCRWVKVDVASHSPQMDPLREDLLSALDGIDPRAGTVPVYSTVTGSLASGAEMDIHYWADNLREPVLFADQVARLVEDGVSVFIEMSPHPILLPAVEQVASESGTAVAALPSLRRREEERDTLLGSLGRLHVLGAPARVDRALTPAPAGQKLPHYPWQRERFWIDAPGPGGAAALGRALRGGLLGERFDSPVTPGTHYWQMDLDSSAATASDHRIGGAAVLPGAAFVEMALAMCEQVRPGEQPVLEEFAFREPLILPTRGVRRVQAVLEGSDAGRAQIRFFVREDDGPLCTAETRVVFGAAADPGEPRDPAALAGPLTETVEGPAYYRALAACGLGYGPAFQGITTVSRGGGAALARIAPDPAALPSDPGYRVHPSLLDSALQSAVAPLLGAAWGEGTTQCFVSESIGRLTVYGVLTGELWAYAQCERTDDDRHWRARVRILSGDGTLLADAEDLSVIRLDSVPVLAADEDDPLGKPARGAVAAGLAELPVAERRAAFETAVREITAQVVRLPARRIDPDTPLRSLGIDSLMSLELRNRLEAAFGVELSATLIWNYPTVRDVAPFLAGRTGIALDGDEVHERGHEQGRAAEAPVLPLAMDEETDPESLEALLGRELAELSERMETF
ncbi:acyltransferase domain-containing protein [Streptomyces sp. NBC_00503]|uniref:acyltransferase domain-containing protein n=1 Tax=Streptomyces sp. NBC_00503 TaxID=2903659 RepID=UPI002E810F92|nr:acyltransferase domain-containing protein [Streptomyces sp. NBC_00503]WUD86359.1 acyltransferase domain-containing protein [Streptomyces sp. NBC_00503]